ncbi:hypothetical protein [[Actinomadura] parvosata]|uniref:hypothetical protein n=1 Tax=[Actinomadura] parvosata TaxID=1955412 RepID=UPI0012BBE4AD|nr:hypothetical protein [Nonomuraea sp. ATCC 55076]
MPPPDEPAGSRAAESIDGPGTPGQHRARRARDRDTAATARAGRLYWPSERARRLIERADQLLERAERLIERGDRLLSASSERLSPRQAPTPIGTGEAAGPAAGHGREGAEGDGKAGLSQRAEPSHRNGDGDPIRRTCRCCDKPSLPKETSRIWSVVPMAAPYPRPVSAGEPAEAASALLSVSREIAWLAALRAGVAAEQARVAAERAQQARDRAPVIAERLAQVRRRLRANGSADAATSTSPAPSPSPPRQPPTGGAPDREVS